MDKVREALKDFDRHAMPDLWTEIEERRLLGDPVAHPNGRGPRRGRRVSSRVVLAATAAAIALVILVPLVVPSGPGGADPAAAAMLRKVARRAAAQPAKPAPGPGEYLYTKSRSQQMYLYVGGPGLRNFYFTQPLTRQSWHGLDGSGRLLETGGEVSFPSEPDHSAWVAAGSPDLNQAQGDETFAPGEWSYHDYSNLPTDPVQLLSLIEQRTIEDGPSGDWETFAIVGDLLRETYTSPAVRGALFEVAADLPGVEYVGRTRDAAGRAGVAVAYTHEGVRDELIFDPTTAQLLGETSILTEDSDVDVESGGPGAVYGLVGHAGMAAYEAAYVASGVVDSVNATH